MNADLLAMLGGAGGMPGGGGGAGGGSSSGNRRGDEGKVVLSIKAGKMDHVLQPNGKYLVTPNLRRGEVNLLWQTQTSTTSTTSSSTTNNNPTNGVLKLEWKDRRTQATERESTIFPEDGCTYTKVPTGREEDRVYVLQYANSDRRFFFWMQDKSVEQDEVHRKQFQKFLKSPAACSAEANGGTVEGGGTSGGGTSGASSGGSTTLDLSGIAAQAGSANAASSGSASGGTSSGRAMDNAALVQIMQGIGAGGGSAGGASGRGTTTPSSSNSGGAAAAASGGNAGSGGVDALSTILQNMGMPPPASAAAAAEGSGASASSNAAAAATTTTTPATTSSSSSSKKGGTLTLADLQGAMAGLATSSPPTTATPGPPLSEVASPAAVESSGILENAAFRAKLMSLLPENQRTDEGLKENIRSPQVAQSLQSLSSALVGDAATFHEVLANFQMDPKDGHAALASGNSIQAFLDCLLASVQKEKKEEEEEKTKGKEEETKGEKKEEEEGKEGGGGEAMEE